MFEFCGINLKIVNSNVGSNKTYSHLYDNVLRNLKPSDSTIKKVYKSNHVKHFYDRVMIDKFKSRWISSN